MLKLLNKLINGDIALGFYLAAIFWIAALGWTISYIPTTQEKEACYQSAAKAGHDTSECKSFWEQTTSEPVAFFTLILAFSTIGMWLATIGLYRANRRQIKALSDDFNATHRPKIRLKHLWLNSDIQARQPVIVSATCVNTGTAEARLHELGLRFEVVPDGEMLPPGGDIAAVYHAGGAVLRCGLNYNFPLINIRRNLTPTEDAEIRMRRSQLFCVGYISYFDGAGRMRITGFCRALKFPTNNLPFAVNSRFRRFRDPDYEYED